MTVFKRRDELVVCIRDMVFLVCGVVLIITGHVYWAIAAFIGALFRMEIGNIITFAKVMRRYKSQVRTMREVTNRIVNTAEEKGVLAKEEVDFYRKTLGDKV